MNKIDYNIEFAHIYVNEAPTNEHFTAAAIAQKTIALLEGEGKSCVLTVLIDDYNPSDSTLNVTKFLDGLESMGAKPDYVVMESELAKFQKIALDEMNGKIKRLYSKYIDKNSKCPCSFLVAIWHLMRLGVFSTADFLVRSPQKGFCASNIVTILPERYKSIEKKATDIIKSTKYSDYVKQTEYVYF